MSRLTQLTANLKNRKALITIAAILLFINLFRLVIDHFNQMQAAIENRAATLAQYRIATRKLEEMRDKVAWLGSQKEIIDAHLLTGDSEEKMISDMQLALQEQITMAGLAVESLRPTRRIDKTKDQEMGYGEVAIKIRLSGTLNQFVDFLAHLYQSPTLYQVESITLKPYKENLKIFFDVKGYYKIPA
jgi:hypothetical protein